METEGSLPLGFLAGFFGGCIGAILVHFIAKGQATKKGAYIGFGVGLVLWGGLSLLSTLLTAGMQ